MNRYRIFELLVPVISEMLGHKIESKYDYHIFSTTTYSDVSDMIDDLSHIRVFRFSQFSDVKEHPYYIVSIKLGTSSITTRIIHHQLDKEEFSVNEIDNPHPIPSCVFAVDDFGPMKQLTDVLRL